MMAPPPLSPCATIVAKHDNDRYLTALFAPADRREGLMALYAFNHEVAKTREVVTEPTLGLIRLQWWRESIEGAYAGTLRRHEVVEPLAAAIAAHRPDRALFDRLIDGREADLDDTAPADMECLINYAQVTGAPLVRLACQMLGVRDEAVMEAARLVGTAWALTGILRATPFLARGHRSRLPLTLMAEHGVSEPSLFDLKPQAGLAKVAEAVAGAARTHLDQARALRGKVPKAALPALLPAVLADHWLGRMEKTGYDLLSPTLLRPSVRRPLAVGWAATWGRW